MKRTALEMVSVLLIANPGSMRNAGSGVAGCEVLALADAYGYAFRERLIPDGKPPGFRSFAFPKGTGPFRMSVLRTDNP